MDCENLSIKEIETIQEALDAWVDKDASSEMFGGLMEAMIFSKDKPAPEDFKREQQARKLMMIEAKKQRAEFAVLLKAKLIQMKNLKRRTESHSELPA